MSDTYIKLLILLADIRVAAGDPEGKLTHPELVERIRQLRRERDSALSLMADLLPMLDYVCEADPVGDPDDPCGVNRASALRSVIVDYVKGWEVEP